LFLVLAIRDITEAAAIAVPESWTASYDPMVVKDGIEYVSMDEGPKERKAPATQHREGPAGFVIYYKVTRIEPPGAQPDYGMFRTRMPSLSTPRREHHRRHNHNSSACFEGTSG
jgi:hypothetical protein